MSTEQIPFLAHLALADSAARVFAEERTSKNQAHAVSRRILRRDAVTALRFLWQTGTVGQRVTVACRVASWMGRPMTETMQRVTAREMARAARSLETERRAA